jgi:Ca2+-binding EF-hand superfamily protein
MRGLLMIGVLVVVPTVASAQQPCTTDARHVVNELYRHMLERSAGPDSDAWVQQLQSGTTVREIVRRIAKSPEHAQRFYNPGEGAVAHEHAVANLYRHILGRQPDAAGQRAFADLAVRNRLSAVVDAIVDSTEYNQTFGDRGVPGSGGLVYCGNGSTQSAAGGSSGVATSRMRWAGLDTDHDGVITRQEWRGNNRSFALHDWNGDGQLSGEEVQAGATPPANAAESRDYSMPVNDRFDYLDVNNNGAVDRNEWDGSLDTFYRLDENDDGRLTRAELGSTRSNSFASIDANRDDRISLGEWPWSHRSFDQQDTNGDGVITANEFRGVAVPRQ